MTIRPFSSNGSAGQRSYRARWIFPVADRPIRDGMVTIDQGNIGLLTTDICKSHAAAPSDLGNIALLPAFINPHTHLEFSDLVAPLPAPSPHFADWLRSVIACRDQRLASGGGAPSAPAVLAGAREGLDTGTIGVGEIATAWDTTLDQSSLPLQGIIFQEWISLNPERTSRLLGQADQWHAKIQREVCPIATSLWRIGLSPHAPYTASLALVQGAIERSRRWKLPLAMHLAESLDEMEFLAGHGGEIGRLLRERDVWNADAIPRGITVSDYLRLLVEADRVLVIHGNHLNDDDLSRLKQHADHLALVHCPRTHAHFQRQRFPLAKLLQAEVPVVLGTDSRSSSPDLSMWAELQAARRMYPDVPPDCLLELGTSRAAQALGLPREMGTLAVCGPAHMVAIELPSRESDDPYDLLWDPTSRLVGCMYRGQWWRVPAGHSELTA